MKRLASFWRNLTRRRAVEEDLSDELKATFDLLVEEKVAAGLRPEEARRMARLELGSGNDLGSMCSLLACAAVALLSPVRRAVCVDPIRRPPR